VNELNERMLLVLAALARLDGPTLAEWAMEADIPLGSIQYYRDELIRRGLVTFKPGKVRMIRLTPKGKAYGRNSV
jgi:DNA-binding MarR family transcriptional regulator